MSRSDLFEDDTGHVEDNAAAEYPSLSFAFEEVRHDSPEPDAPTADAEPEVLEFQLFGGSGPVSVDLAEQPDEVRQERPVSFYTYSASADDRARVLATAVSGDFVLAEAAALARLAARNPIAKDVNADWRPAKRRCRPGKEARQKKKLRNERIDAARKTEAEQWKQRRRAYKPRGPKRPKTGFTFK